MKKKLVKNKLRKSQAPYTKEEFLKRCANAYDMGLIKTDVIHLLAKWTDIVMRVEGGQDYTLLRFFLEEAERTQNFASHKVLANDKVGYSIIQLAAIFEHPCQKCAEDPQAWHTRFAFCNHKDE